MSHFILNDMAVYFENNAMKLPTETGLISMQLEQSLINVQLLRLMNGGMVFSLSY